jgi:hypothetical protein
VWPRRSTTGASAILRWRSSLLSAPLWVQRSVALATVAVVVAAAWAVCRDRQTPWWLDYYLVPLLSWSWIVLATLLLVTWCRRR